MSKTMADHARAYRQRKAERVARYERALVLIASGISVHDGDHVDIARKALGR